MTLFSDKLDLKGSINNGANKYVFTTKDGMKWTFLNFNFTANNADSDVLLMVDVNGDKGPNCGQYSASGQCSDKNRTTGFDRFTMKILARGKIQIIDCWAAMAAKIDKKLVGKEKVSQEEAELANCSLSASSNKIAILNGIEYKLIENFRYDLNDTSKYINAYVYADADGNYIYNERIYYLQPDGTYKTSDGLIYDSNLKLTGRITNGYEYELKGDVLLRAINNSTYQYQGTGSGKYKQIEDGKYYSTWENRIFDSEFNTLGRYKDKELTDYYEFKNGFFVKEETPGGNYIDTSKRVYVKDSDGYYVYNNIYYYDKDMNLVKKYLIKEGNFYEYKKDSDISVREIGDGVYKDFTGKTLTRNSDGYYVRSDGNVYDDEFIYIGNINN